MGKIVKYCSTCEEGFSEKFSFCPNCASELTAFEMKPVASEPDKIDVVEEPVDEIKTEARFEETHQDVFEEPETEVLELADATTSVDIEPEEVIEPAEIEETVFEPVSFEAETESEVEDLMVEEFESESADEGIKPSKEKAAVAAVTSPVTTLFGAEGIPESESWSGYTYSSDIDDDFHVTVVNEGGGSLKRNLLLGASLLVLSVAFGSLLWSIFNHPFFVAAIGDEIPPISITELTPLEIEEEAKKDNDKDGGGGGGGGKQEKDPASQGELPSQSRNPITPPSPTIPRLTNPELVMKQETEGDIKRDRQGRTGIPDSLNLGTSSGTGSGGGIGSGRGTGVGSGRGTGEGSGIGSGSGGGVGDGNGDGTGSGGRARTAPPAPARPAGPTVGIKILSKPRPGYTDTARQNNVQGTVMLRVTFNANGSVGGIASVKGLPHGLTEKAIAAARQIRFTPAMRNGQPYSVTKRIQYNFTIY